MAELEKNIEMSKKQNLPIIDSKFRAIEILHKGKYSTIYKVIPLLNPEKIIALKIFYYKKSKSEIYKKSFSTLIRGEFYLYKKLESEFFPKVYEIGYDKKLSSIYYTMELLDNCESLYSYYKKLLKHNNNESVDEKLFKEIVYKTILALTYLHSFDLIHYNITPKNILVFFPDKKKPNVPEIRIISLSLAERNKNFKKNKYRKNHYLSPEVISNDPKIDYRTDYFSFGVTMLHSLLIEYTKEVFSDFLTKKPISTELNLTNIKGYLGLIENTKIRNFLANLLQEDPNKRFYSARKIIIALNNDFNENYQVSKFYTDFSFKQQKGKFIIRNKIIHEILESYQNEDNNPENNDINIIKPQFTLIEGKSGYGVSRTIQEIENTFSYLMYDSITIKSKQLGNIFEEIVELLNKLLIRNNHNCKITNRKHLALIKRITTEIRNKNDISIIFNEIYEQIETFTSNSKVLIIFSDIHKYDLCSLKFIHYLKSINNSSSNLFIIASFSYKTDKERDSLEKIIFYDNNLNVIKLKSLNIDNLKLLRKHLFGKIIDIPKNFDDFVLKHTQGSFKKVVLLYDKLLKNEVIFYSFRSYYYNTENKYLKNQYS